MKELNNAKNDMEKNEARLTTELKALREKNDKVFFFNQSSTKNAFLLI